MTTSELKTLEKQLSRPEGTFGIELGKRMNKSNMSMTLETIKAAQIADNFNVLELGHGICGHLLTVLQQAENISYQGLEVSELIVEEAKRINKNLINQDNNFTLYNGVNIPFSENQFGVVFSVNTIYFWKKPQKVMAEISRVLKTNGIALLTYAEKEFMKKLPFVMDKFKLYDVTDIDNLLDKSILQIERIIEKEEQVISKSGEDVLRKYQIVVIRKK